MRPLPPVHPVIIGRALRGLGQVACTPGATGYPPSNSPWVNFGTTSVGGTASAIASAPTSESDCASGSFVSSTSTQQTAAKTGSMVSGASSVGASLLALSPVTGPAAPFVAIAGALAAFATGVLHIGQGCGATCINATEVANYTECIMAANLNTYMNTPAPRYASAQAAALAVFNSAWQYLVQGCGEVGGSAGSNCVSQRNRGGEYDDWASFYDPINNDPCVIADPTPVDAVTGATTTVEGAVSSATNAITSTLSGILGTSSSSSILLPLIIIAGVALLLGGGL